MVHGHDRIEAPASARGPAVPTVLDAIGNTPLLALEFAAEQRTVYAKAEFLNPSGSIKDRLARCVIAEAEAAGALRRGDTIVECTSGNTGIALAMVGAVKGYRVRILMSETASVERRHLMHQFGAELVLFRAERGYATGIELAEQMAARDPRVFLPRQFSNPANAHDHETTTGPEMLAQVPGGRIDVFVSGYGTGGTLTGCGRALRRAHPAVRIVAVEPAEAAMLAGECPCCHFIEGIAGGYVPPLLDRSLLSATDRVPSAEALAMARRLAREFGLLVGTSSGANVAAALRAAVAGGPGCRVATILCDRAERYYSTRLFGD